LGAILKTHAFVLAGVCACFLPSHGFANDRAAIFGKPGATLASREAVQGRCHRISESAPLGDLPEPAQPINLPISNGAGGLPGVAGVAIADMIIISIAIHEQRVVAEALCIRNLGYVSIPLTPDEAAVYGSLSGTNKDKWEETFLAGDIGARYQALVAPVVPRLPAYREEPLEQGGLKIDGDSLTAVSELTDKGDVVTGKAIRSRTAVLVTPIKITAGSIVLSAEPGAVFHQVDYRRQTAPLLRLDGATWCGPVLETANGNTSNSFYCFTGRDNGYEVYRPSGQQWFAGPYLSGFKLPVYTQPIKLEERAQDDLGPIDFAIAVTAIHHRTLDVAAYLRRDGKEVEVWSRELEFNINSKTVLRLWSMDLVFSKDESNHLQVELLHDGDGTSWREGG
jgi:hypothetical protein